MPAYQKRTGIMLFKPFEERMLSIRGWNWPIAVQPKLDGERCRVITQEERYPLQLSSTEEIITGTPTLGKEGLLELPEGREFDGELYVHEQSWEEIHSVVSRGPENPHPKEGRMEYHVFDLAEEDGRPFIERYVELMDIFKRMGRMDYVKLVPLKLCFTMEEVMGHYRECLEQGYEGIILRDIRAPYERKRSQFGMKFKPKKKDWYRIVGCTKADAVKGVMTDMVGAFWCVDRHGERFKVGAGEMTHEERRKWWRAGMDWEAARMYCCVGYQNLTAKNKIPRHGLVSDPGKVFGLTKKVIREDEVPEGEKI